MSHDASWGIAAKLGTRAIQRRRLHAHAMYGCWIMHEITLIGWPVTCGRDYLPITSACGATVPTVIPMLLSNAQILRRGHAARRLIAIRRHARGMRPRAVDLLAVPFNMFKALVVLLNVLRAAITELPTHLAVVDQRNCGRDASPKWNLPATTRLQQADRGMKIVYEPLLDGREATVVHAVLVSWQQTSSGQLQWSRWIGFQDRWCFSSVSFLCTRRACGVTTCGVTSCPWFRPLS